MTSGNQAWNGAAPIFSNNEEFKIKINIFIEFWGRNSFIFIDIKIAKSKIKEAKVCVMKYFIAASEG